MNNIVHSSAVLARLGLKAQALAWPKAALAFSNARPGQSCQPRLGLGLAWPMAVEDHLAHPPLYLPRCLLHRHRVLEAEHTDPCSSLIVLIALSWDHYAIVATIL